MKPDSSVPVCHNDSTQVMDPRIKSILMLTLIWVVVPLGLVVLGYGVIGPHLGASNIPLKIGQAAPVTDNSDSNANQGSSTSDSSGDGSSDNSSDNGDSGTQTSSHHFSPPQVDVQVEPGAQFSVRQGYAFHGSRRRKRRKARSSTPAIPVENQSAPRGASDGGGSTDGGGQG